VEAIGPRHVLAKLIRAALDEDVGAGDVTTGAALRGDEAGIARTAAKTGMIVAGIDLFGQVFLALDSTVIFKALRRDGERVNAGEPLAELSGRLASILTAERVALNLFQRMSGIATKTRRYVDRVSGLPVRILDTRKTVPGLRILDKYAVRVGGGFNHRFALYDGVLIKDNHIAAAGGIGPAVRRVRERIPHTLKIEVEVKNLAELDEAIAVNVDAVLLDNMGLAEMAAAVRRVGGRMLCEASGNMTLERIREVAETGVDLISVGALTHSVEAADISLNITQVKGGGR
jgi:nicotinate-nucleotide pyrophosphorylase (carboxylating)